MTCSSANSETTSTKIIRRAGGLTRVGPADGVATLAGFNGPMAIVAAAGRILVVRALPGPHTAGVPGAATAAESTSWRCQQVEFDMGPYRPWLNLVHVLAVMAFVLVHGASGLLALKIRRERDRDRIATMLHLSSSFLVWGWIALAVVFFGGILAGIAGGWWTSGQLWIWASLAVFIAVALLMTPIASSYMESVRHAVGLPSIVDQRKKREAPAPASDEELALILDSSKPIWAAAIGVAGIAILTWLMMFKPF